VADRQGAYVVKRHLEDARSNADLVMACIWGAVNGTAPADRWGMAAADLAAAEDALAKAKAALAAMEKLEPYCTVCGEPILNLTAGWSHFTAAGDAVLADQAGHQPDLDWRPIGGASHG
jgi:hypothetical protein